MCSKINKYSEYRGLENLDNVINLCEKSHITIYEIKAPGGLFKVEKTRINDLKIQKIAEILSEDQKKINELGNSADSILYQQKLGNIAKALKVSEFPISRVKKLNKKQQARKDLYDRIINQTPKQEVPFLQKEKIQSQETSIGTTSSKNKIQSKKGSTLSESSSTSSTKMPSVTDSEYDITSTSDETTSEEIFFDLEEDKKEFFNQFDQLESNYIKNPIHLMRRFYMKVLETEDINSFRNFELDGYTQSGALYSYLEDLKKYREQMIAQNLSPSKKLNILINEIEFAYKISLTNRVNPNNNTALKIKDSIIDEIHQRIVELPTSNSIGGPCVLIPGGHKRHGVMYKIEKEQNGTFSFTIINTGESSDLNYLSSAWGILTKNRLIVQDIVYKNLTKNDLSEGFILNLLNEKLHPNMESINNMLHEYFMRSHEVEWEYGRKHNAQLKGSCAFKNVSSVIHEKLGDREYNPFKTFVTQREINALEKLNVDSAHQNLKREMLDKGLNKRWYRKNKIT